jgi:hypothetical protein
LKRIWKNERNLKEKGLKFDYKTTACEENEQHEEDVNKKA